MASQSLSMLLTELAGGRVRIVDLTVPLAPDTPIIHLPPQFAQSHPLTVEVISKFDAQGPGWYWNNLEVGEHTGTHFDAPIHWATGKDLPNNTTDTIAPEKFVGPACVIDVSGEVAKNPDFLLTPERILAWEKDHGKIPRQSWVLLRTGWSERRGDAYLNDSPDGPHSPGFHKSASEFLARDRDVLGVGVETVGTDAGQAAKFDPPFPNHSTMHGAGKFGLASLCNLDQLPPIGAIVIAAPLKIVNGSGSPCRALALVPN
ncbi:MAG: cyclase family protein [Candidatus Binataceae bacterium]|nr:cyclase family protein [Candidatus Binataceae bacterium]